jgi:hypothetical protein
MGGGIEQLKKNVCKAGKLYTRTMNRINTGHKSISDR